MVEAADKEGGSSYLGCYDFKNLKNKEKLENVAIDLISSAPFQKVITFYTPF